MVVAAKYIGKFPIGGALTVLAWNQKFPLLLIPPGLSNKVVLWVKGVAALPSLLFSVSSLSSPLSDGTVSILLQVADRYGTSLLLVVSVPCPASEQTYCGGFSAPLPHTNTCILTSRGHSDTMWEYNSTFSWPRPALFIQIYEMKYRVCKGITNCFRSICRSPSTKCAVYCMDCFYCFIFKTKYYLSNCLSFVFPSLLLRFQGNRHFLVFVCDIFFFLFRPWQPFYIKHSQKHKMF